MSILFITRFSTWYWYCWGKGNLNRVGGWFITGVKRLGCLLGVSCSSARWSGQKTTAAARHHHSPTCLAFRLGTGTGSGQSTATAARHHHSPTCLFFRLGTGTALTCSFLGASFLPSILAAKDWGCAAERRRQGCPLLSFAVATWVLGGSLGSWSADPAGGRSTTSV